ncbi:hypothetical protein GCM10028774_11320 [Spirosoma jeollabukense]
MFSCKELIDPSCGNATFIISNRSTQILDYVVINGGSPKGCDNLLPNDKCSTSVPSKTSISFSAVGKKGGKWEGTRTFEDCQQYTLDLTD